MKSSLFIVCLAVQTASITGETSVSSVVPGVDLPATASPPASASSPQSLVPAPSRPNSQDIKPRVWLGVKLSKPDSTITAHLPGLPMGMGFLVRNVEPGGPAEQAGMQSNDILWKLGEQWLANESQLSALLRLSSVGDEVTLSGFRAGKTIEFKVHLAQAPMHQRVIPAELVDSAIFPGECGGPWRVINVSEKLASFATPEGKVEVRKVDDGYAVKITAPNQVVIYDGPLAIDGTVAPYAEPWPRRVQALKRGLDHALAGNIPMRQPRPRVVSPPPTVQPDSSNSPAPTQHSSQQASW